mgnify:CR=1 FL=1
MFEATLKNRSSAHFAPVTSTFPIPEDQYEQAILALEKSQIGDARVQDCLIDNVHTPNCPALVRMAGAMANVDELDWLGKQLESFDRYELLQFNAAVERFGLLSNNKLSEQLRRLKQEKARLLDTDSDDLADRTRDLMDTLTDGPDFLDSFDAELFDALVEKIIVDSNERLRFRLKNGLELAEQIERTKR